MSRSMSHKTSLILPGLPNCLKYGMLRRKVDYFDWPSAFTSLEPTLVPT